MCVFVCDYIYMWICMRVYVYIWHLVFTSTCDFHAVCVCLCLCLCLFVFCVRTDIKILTLHAYTHPLRLPATPCYTLQHPATPCNTLQHPATPCNTMEHSRTPSAVYCRYDQGAAAAHCSRHLIHDDADCCRLLQTVAVCCSVLQNVAECCRVCALGSSNSALQHTTTRTLHHTLQQTNSNTL